VRLLLKYFGLALCCGCVVLTAYFFARLPDYLDPQGIAPKDMNAESCFSAALPDVAGGDGLVVSGHHTYCDNFIHDSAVYVYLHRVNEPADRRHLVFRYSDYAWLPEPKIRWTGTSALYISVGPVVEVTKEVSSMEGVRITYSIKSEQYSRRDADREVYDVLLLAGGVLLFGILMAILSWRLIRSIRRGRRNEAA
jgi:hypothetical protein